MKKILLLLSAALLTFLLISCGGKENNIQTNGTDTEKTDTIPDTVNTTDTENADELGSGFSAIGEVLTEDFKKRVQNNPEISAEELAGVLLTNDTIDFAGTTMVMEPGYFMGIDLDEVTGFEEAARFSPMIGSIPFMGYVFKLGNDANAEEFSELLMEHADLGWNICTFADHKVSAVEENYVFFLMYEA